MISLAKAEGLWLELSFAVESALAVGTGETATMRHAQRLLELIHYGLQGQKGNSIKLHMCESLFVHSGIPLADASIRGRATIAFLRFTQSGGVHFTTEIDLASIVELIDLARGVCKGEDKAMSSFDYTGPLSEVVVLGNIALIHPGATLKWDAAKMEITNHEPANTSLFMRRIAPRDELNWY